jgi:hypothetical protein
MHRVVNPTASDMEGMGSPTQDLTAPEGLCFYHAEEGKPLATPWQIAVLRAMMVANHTLPQGWILDCACGSGIQLSAYASVLHRPVLGIELGAPRAMASAVNLRTVAQHQRGEQEAWFIQSTLVAGDGTQAKAALEAAGEDQRVALLHLDPARPRNSRTHALDEMQPALHEVLSAWSPYFEGEPAVLLDLSPRLTPEQREEVEGLVDEIWPNIGRTWEWTSRGQGRVDRLALWLGRIADQDQLRRFVRVPPSLGAPAHIITSNNEPLPLEPTVHPPQRGEFVSLLDAALVESGLVSTWMERVSKDRSFRWAFVEGRRPQVHHDHALRLNEEDNRLVQATGRVVELLPMKLSEDTIDAVVEHALEHNLRSVKLRLELDPTMQPVLQGSLDRQLQRRHGHRDGFLTQHPNGNVLLLCIVQSEEPQ